MITLYTTRFGIQKHCAVPTNFVCVFGMNLRSDNLSIQRQVICSYNRDGEYLLRGPIRTLSIIQFISL